MCTAITVEYPTDGDEADQAESALMHLSGSIAASFVKAVFPTQSRRKKFSRRLVTPISRRLKLSPCFMAGIGSSC
jgi:hypothetical protein